MTLDADRKNELDQAWMDGLLRAALCKEPEQDNDRIHLLFGKSDFVRPESNSSFKRKTQSVVRWFPLALAASLIIALSGWFLIWSPNQRAYAAISRSLQATPMSREYSIAIRSRTPGGIESTKKAQVFIDAQDRVVVHRLGWLGLGDVWIGTDGTNQWVVPRFGPAIQGSESLLGGWLLKKDSTAPYLHIKTILKRMKNSYTLTILPTANLDGANGKVDCERVQGDLHNQVNREKNPAMPYSIELWADRETGIAHRVILNWNREPDAIGPLQWNIDLQGFPSLPENWFEPTGHTGPGQRIIKIGRESELDALPKSSDE